MLRVLLGPVSHTFEFDTEQDILSAVDAFKQANEKLKANASSSEPGAAAAGAGENALCLCVVVLKRQGQGPHQQSSAFHLHQG